VAAVAETAAAVTLVNGANRAGKQRFMQRPSIEAGRTVQGSACEEEATLESFKKRQKEMRRLERQRDTVAKRKEIKAREAAGLTNGPDRDTETRIENAAAYDAAAEPSATN
jgi:hypothetical protein